MACQRKENGGYCGHYQCPFASETTHGYECVDILYPENSSQGFCEVGENCHDQCEYSWKKDSNSPVELASKQWIQETINILE